MKNILDVGNIKKTLILIFCAAGLSLAWAIYIEHKHLSAKTGIFLEMYSEISDDRSSTQRILSLIAKKQNCPSVLTHSEGYLVVCDSWFFKIPLADRFYECRVPIVYGTFSDDYKNFPLKKELENGNGVIKRIPREQLDSMIDRMRKSAAQP
jgi:hypothetical protein